MDKHCQDHPEFIIETVQDLPLSYRKQLFKWLLSRVDQEEFYTVAASLMLEKEEPLCIKTYVLPGREEWIRIKEDTASISQGTTGLKTWQASLALVEYLVEHPDLIRGKRVLELGSGCGLLGLSCYRLGARVTLTDYPDLVLDRIIENARLNGILVSHGQFIDPLNVTKGTTSHQSKIIVDRMDWEDPFFLPTDVIVCADVIYDPSLIPPLVKTLKCLLKGNACLLAHTLRRQETLDLFTHQLTKMQLSWVQLPKVGPHFYYNEDYSAIQLLKISQRECESIMTSEIHQK